MVDCWKGLETPGCRDTYPVHSCFGQSPRIQNQKWGGPGGRKRILAPQSWDLGRLRMRPPCHISLPVCPSRAESNFRYTVDWDEGRGHLLLPCPKFWRQGASENLLRIPWDFRLHQSPCAELPCILKCKGRLGGSRSLQARSTIEYCGAILNVVGCAHGIRLF